MRFSLTRMDAQAILRILLNGMEERQYRSPLPQRRVPPTRSFFPLRRQSTNLSDGCGLALRAYRCPGMNVEKSEGQSSYRRVGGLGGGDRQRLRGRHPP